MNRILHCLTIVLAISITQDVSARTNPVKGAVSKPRRLKIRAPFPCGVTFKINCGYNGSKAHSRVRHTNSTNDYYALDMTRVEPQGGYDKVVLAVADGIVRYAGWAKRGWSPYGKIVYIEHAYSDRKGKRYHSMYAHLHRVKVRKGQRIKAGTVIGTMGGSSRRRHLKFPPHLHFAMYRGAKRTLGGGNAVVPEPLGRHEDLRRGLVLKACGKPGRRIVWMDLPDGAAAVGGLE
jgi:Peptidase family M23